MNTTLTPTAIPWRYPDKPSIISCDHLPALEAQGDWLAQVKLGGLENGRKSWRCVLEAHPQGVRAFTRHHMRVCNALHRDDDFGPELLQQVQDLGLPAGTVLDAEYMQADPEHEVDEFLMIFDAMFYNYRWLGESPYHMRAELAAILMREGREKCGHDLPGIWFPETVASDFRDFYERSRECPLFEGIVLKRVQSTLIGSPNKSATNPEWVKAKWRTD